jgi:hypothetical protein
VDIRRGAGRKTFAKNFDEIYIEKKLENREVGTFGREIRQAVFQS